MNTRIFDSFLLFLFFAFSVSGISAQKVIKNSSEIVPYVVGETLTYEGKFSRIIKGIPVAALNFSVEPAPNGRDYVIKSEAESKGTLAKLFRFDFLQRMQSTVNAETLNILKTVKHDKQNDRVRDSEAVFDYNNKQVTYVETDPKNATRPPRKVASEIQNQTQDFITGMYTLRRLPLAVGETFELMISDSGLVYKVPVRVTAREQQKSILGKIWCFRVVPEIFGENRLVEQDGSMIIWITDDMRRLPIRAQINADVGRLEVKLKSITYTTRNITATK